MPGTRDRDKIHIFKKLYHKVVSYFGVIINKTINFH